MSIALVDKALEDRSVVMSITDVGVGDSVTGRVVTGWVRVRVMLLLSGPTLEVATVMFTGAAVCSVVLLAPVKLWSVVVMVVIEDEFAVEVDTVVVAAVVVAAVARFVAFRKETVGVDADVDTATDVALTPARRLLSLSKKPSSLTSSS